MPETAPWWQTLLGIGGYLAIIGVPVAAALWARRRRLSGDEASSGTDRGAEAMIPKAFP